MSSFNLSDNPVRGLSLSFDRSGEKESLKRGLVAEVMLKSRSLAPNPLLTFSSRGVKGILRGDKRIAQRCPMGNYLATMLRLEEAVAKLLQQKGSRTKFRCLNHMV